MPSALAGRVVGPKAPKAVRGRENLGCLLRIWRRAMGRLWMSLLGLDRVLDRSGGDRKALLYWHSPFYLGAHYCMMPWKEHISQRRCCKSSYPRRNGPHNYPYQRFPLSPSGFQALLENPQALFLPPDFPVCITLHKPSLLCTTQISSEDDCAGHCPCLAPASSQIVRIHSLVSRPVSELLFCTFQEF